jgi:hypothetical protein
LGGHPDWCGRNLPLLIGSLEPTGLERSVLLNVFWQASPNNAAMIQQLQDQVRELAPGLKLRRLQCVVTAE